MIWACLYLIEDFDISVSVSPQNMKNSRQLSRKPAPPCRSQGKSRASNIKKETESRHYALVVIQCNMLGIVTEIEAIKANNNEKLPYGAITNMVKAQKGYLPWLKESRLLVMKGRC